MRLCPIGGHSLERVAPAGGIELASKFVPQGTVIGVSIQEIHLNPDVFGADPEQFRPERWIEADETSAKWMESCSLGVS